VTDSNGFRTDDETSDDASGTPQVVEVLVLGPSSAFGWGVEYHETYAVVVARTAGQGLLNASQVGYGINDIDRFRFSGLMMRALQESIK
jgi:hypothetical protein